MKKETWFSLFMTDLQFDLLLEDFCRMSTGKFCSIKCDILGIRHQKVKFKFTNQVTNIQNMHVTVPESFAYSQIKK